MVEGSIEVLGRVVLNEGHQLVGIVKLTRDGARIGKVGILHATNTSSIALNGRFIIAGAHELEGAIGAGGHQEDLRAESEDHLDRGSIRDPGSMDRDDALAVIGTDGAVEEISSSSDTLRDIQGDKPETGLISKVIHSIPLPNSDF